jgi:dTDP-glucose pyrophosphorylase
VTRATKAVILARGLGTRMRREDSAAALTPEQAAAAAAGVKGMIDVGRPFLDYALSALADAGFEEACLVIGPEHDVVRRRYEREARPERIAVRFAVQQRPLGTADAVLAAEAFAAGEPFVVVNADNYYPPDALARLRAARVPALIGFDAEALVHEGNVSPERIARFALLEVDAAGELHRISEKPSAATLDRLGAHRAVSMTCWLFGPEIFEACRRITPSPRGELELPDAVQWLAERGARFTVIPMRAPVLDLSSRADVAEVARRLRGVEPRP